MTGSERSFSFTPWVRRQRRRNVLYPLLTWCIVSCIVTEKTIISWEINIFSDFLNQIQDQNLNILGKLSIHYIRIIWTTRLSAQGVNLRFKICFSMWVMVNHYSTEKKTLNLDIFEILRLMDNTPQNFLAHKVFVVCIYFEFVFVMCMIVLEFSRRKTVWICHFIFGIFNVCIGEIGDIWHTVLQLWLP